MRKVQYFKSTKQTNRFNKNQKVWIRSSLGNHFVVWFRYRGRGRFVSGICDKSALYVGEIHTIEVDEHFANRIEKKNCRIEK